MRQTIEHIIRNRAITTVFQPIVDVIRNEIIGYEALSRGPAGTALYFPDVLFETAIANGKLSELEILCRDKAIFRFAELKLAGKLFINISPMILLNNAHPYGETVRMVENSGLTCDRIVIEISEKYPIDQPILLKNSINRYRQFGFEVAIDDFGAGYCGLKQWSEILPDIIKIDRYFIDNCHNDMIKKEFLRTIFELGRITNALVIAEGIEQPEEYSQLMDLGMQFAQGYLFARPNASPLNQLSNDFRKISTSRGKGCYVRHS